MNNFSFPVTDVKSALSDENQDPLDPSHYMIKEVYNKVTERAPLIEFGIPLTLEEICGKEYWDSLSPGDKKYAGKCMKELVEAGLVPFSKVEKKHEYPPMFERI